MRTLALALCGSVVTLGCSSIAQDEPEGGESTGTAPTTGGAASERGESADALGGSGTASTDTAADDESGIDDTTGGTATTGGTTVTPSAGCGIDPNVTGTIEVDGEERTFELSVPMDYDPDKPYPLVFAWHGAGGFGALASAYFGIEFESRGEAVFVYPDGLDVPTGGTGWDLEDGGRDMLFFDAMLGALSDGLCIDTERVFSTGHSFGGFMSNSLGCFRGDEVRAIAPVASGGPFPTAMCTGQVAAWIAHGPTDPTVPFTSGEGSRDFWSAANGCSAETQATEPDPCVALSECDAGYDVVWCAHDETMMLDGHDWPTFAAPGIWAFFASF